MDEALILIDIQNDYFPGGRMEVEGAGEAAKGAGELLAFFRARGMPVIHVRHLSVRPGAAFLLPGTPGAEIHESVAPVPGEALIEKKFPNAFRETGLDGLLKDRGIKALVVAGMMSQMCVDTTVRAAFDLGYRVTVAHDCCAAAGLTFGGEKIPGTAVHGAFMASLGAVFARVASAGEIIGARQGIRA